MRSYDLASFSRCASIFMCCLALASFLKSSLFPRLISFNRSCCSWNRSGCNSLRDFSIARTMGPFWKANKIWTWAYVSLATLLRRQMFLPKRRWRQTHLFDGDSAYILRSMESNLPVDHTGSLFQILPSRVNDVDRRFLRNKSNDVFSNCRWGIVFLRIHHLHFSVANTNLLKYPYLAALNTIGLDHGGTIQ